MKRILILLMIGARKILPKIGNLLVFFLGVFLTRQQTTDEGEGEDYQEGGNLTSNQEKLRKVLHYYELSKIIVYLLFRNAVLNELGLFAEREQLYSEHRADIRFVQYNQLSREIALDSRLMETIRELTRTSLGDEAQEEEFDVIDFEDGLAVVQEVLQENGEYFKAGGSKPGSSCEESQVACEDSTFREIDGTCNNLQNSNWGAAGRILLR